MADIIIAIPSFRRPKGLARLLASLAALKTSHRLRVLVGDNDSEGCEAAKLCARLSAEAYRWPLGAIVVYERGIAQNRNALVAEALRDEAMSHLAMLDDDEFVEPHWLDALMTVAARHDADCVEGPVTGVDDGGQLDENYAGVARHQGASGPVGMLEGGGNLLLSRRILTRMPAPHFDPAYGLSGGEDRDFFVRMAGLSARFAWCAEATCYTEVPRTRQGLRWSLKRAYNNGNTDMRIFLKHNAGAAHWLGALGKAVIALVLALPGAAVLLLSPRWRLWMLQRFFRACGKLAALLGAVPQEYAVSHGE